MNEKNVLILGGSRFIGYLTTIKFAKERWNITVFNRQLSVPPEAFPNNINFIKGDRNNPEDYISVFKKKYDLVIDFSGFKLSQIEPIFSRYSSRIKQYIFISTVEVYKKPYPEILFENSLRNSSEKSLIEDYLVSIKKNNKITILRLQGVFGPYDPCIVGLLFYRIKNNLPIIIKENNSMKNKFLYIYDLIEIIYLLIDNEKSYNKIYNVCGDEEITLNYLIECCANICKKKPIIKNYTDDMLQFSLKHDPNKRHVGISLDWIENNKITNNMLIKDDLEFKFTSINNSLEETYQWLKSNKEKLKYFSFLGENYILSSLEPPHYKSWFWKIINFLDIRSKIKIKIRKFIVFKLKK